MKKQKIIFRADGDSQNGLGHMFRLFAMVDMLEQEFACTFVTRATSTVSALPSSINYSCMPSEVSLDNEVHWLAKNFPSSDYLLVVDGYQFRLDYQAALKKQGYKVVYVDDLCEWHMVADVVINHAPSAFKMVYSKEAYTHLALGTKYSLLRPAFLKLAQQTTTPAQAGRVFVAFGGADPLKLSQKVVDIIYQMPEVKQIDLVQGAASNLANGFEHYANKVKLHAALNEVQLAELMQACSMAIVPTSTVLFEMCCVKRRIVTGYYAANQHAAYLEFVEKKAVIGIGDFRELNEEQLRLALLGCLNANTTTMLAQQSKLFDGNQKERIIEILKQL